LEGSAEFSKDLKIQDFGDIYIQAKFLEEGMVDDGKPAQVIEDIAISGSLLINVVFAKGLRAADSDTSDPYCEILLPDKTKLETKTINNILNPVWNFKSTSVLKIPYEVSYIIGIPLLIIYRNTKRLSLMFMMMMVH